MEIPRELQSVLTADPETMGGVLCFAGTRIPVTILLDNVRAGVSMAEFRDAYPDLSEDQIRTVLEFEDGLARRALGLVAAR